MNKTLVTLIVKLAITFLAAWISIGFLAGNPIGSVFTIALAATIINYIVGDLLILPGLGNMIASVADGVIGIVVALLIGMFFEGFRAPFFSLFVFGILLVIGEFIFHVYLKKSEDTVSVKRL